MILIALFFIANNYAMEVSHVGHEKRNEVRRAVAQYLMAKSHAKSSDSFYQKFQKVAIFFDEDGKARLDDLNKKRRYLVNLNTNKVEETDIN